MTVVKKIPAKQSSSTQPVYYKSATVSDVVVDDESRVVKFYAAIWDTIDDANDILRKGCCSRSIKARGPESTTNRKIKFLYQHDTYTPLGAPITVKEDTKGLYIESPIDEIPKGDDVLTQLKSGTLNQFSIGYMYVQDKCQWVEVPDPDEPKQMIYVRECKEIELFEVSVVTFGCNEETGFEGMKDAQVKSHKNQLIRDTEAALKQLSPDMELLFRQLISKHIALNSINPAEPPLDTVDPSPTKSVDFTLLTNALKN